MKLCCSLKLCCSSIHSLRIMTCCRQQNTDTASLAAGPALMPGGTEEAYKHIEDIVRKVAAQVDDGPCVTYVGNGGAGNFVKMVHNGIEYGDMQLISEAYDILKTVGGFSNEELGEAFDEWNKVSCTS